MELVSLKNTQHHIVPLLQNRIRIVDYLPGIFTSFSSKSAIKKALKKELISIDDTIATTANLVSGGEKIVIKPDVEKTKKPIVELKLDVFYEDDYLAVVFKPAGITVSGNKYHTLENALDYNLKSSNEVDSLVKPEPVHRLDHPTSGLLLVAKTKEVLIDLNKLFENKQVEKKYVAITIGNMEANGVISSPIEQKDCLTLYKVLKSIKSERFDKLNLVDLTPKTGRKHQLRIHMTQNGNPILGDKEHGIEGLILTRKGLYLHAYELKFLHPKTKELISVKAPIPDKFLKIFPDFI